MLWLSVSKLKHQNEISDIIYNVRHHLGSIDSTKFEEFYSSSTFIDSFCPFCHRPGS